MGTGPRNVLYASGCEIQVVGKNGKDSIDTALIFSEPQLPCARAKRTISLAGGGGDDLIRGGPGDVRLSGGSGSGSGSDQLYGDEGADRLVGGAGRDRADGGSGRDTCDAEIERRCER